MPNEKKKKTIANSVFYVIIFRFFFYDRQSRHSLEYIIFFLGGFASITCSFFYNAGIII